MNKELLHVIIAEIANASIEIQKIMKTDKLSYNRKIDDIAMYLSALALQLHNEIFPEYLEDNEEEEEDSEIPF